MVSVRRVVFPGILPSFLKVRWYKWITGAKIGKGFKISLFSYIISPKVEIGDNCKIGPFTFVEASHTLKLGNRVSISMLTNIRTGTLIVDDDSEIMDNVRIGGIHTQKSSLIMGKRVGIFPYAYINPSYEIFLDDDVGIGGRSHLFTHGAWPSSFHGFPMKYAPITIKKNVWLGWRVTILPGVTIGENTVVQADTLVNKSVSGNSVVSGNPSKVSKLYIFKYKDRNKIKLLTNIFTEYNEYLEYLGEKVSLEIRENEFIIFKIYKKKKINNLVIVCLSEYKEEINVIIKENSFANFSLVTFKDDYRKYEFEHKNFNNFNHFNLLNKTLKGEFNRSIQDIREYFKRFGISFNYEK